MDMSGVTSVVHKLYSRFKWLFLFWFNIAGVFLYVVAFEETQNLVLGSIPEHYSSFLWMVARLFLRINTYFFNFALWGWIIWGIFEIWSCRGLVTCFAKSIFNSSAAINLWYLSVFLYVIAGNIILILALILIFFFQDSRLFEYIGNSSGSPLPFQQPLKSLVWPAFAISTIAVIDNLGFYMDYETYKSRREAR